MPKALQKTLLKLGIAGCLALLLFNYPLLSLYQGSVGGLPMLYLVLFGVWLILIVLARHIADSVAPRTKGQSEAHLTHD